MTVDATLERLRDPQTLWGRRYFALLTVTVIASIMVLFIDHEYPRALPLGSWQLWLLECAFLVVFSVDIAVQVWSLRRRKHRRDWGRLGLDVLATVPSLLVVMQPLGWIEASTLDVLVLLRVFRLLRLFRLLRVGNQLTDVFGASVLTLVFGTMAVHLSLRVLLLEISSLTGVDIYAQLDAEALTIAVTAVGAIFGIALAITFGIVKRKQLEITSLHREALDTLHFFEQDVQRFGQRQVSVEIAQWRLDLDDFLHERITYEAIKHKTTALLAVVREAVVERPSMDVPFHRGLVPCMSAFLTKTQLEFHPAFYRWMNRIAHLYFILTLFAVSGLTGMVVQLLVIYVFQGLVVVIDDMDHAVDTQVVIFNAKILPV